MSAPARSEPRIVCCNAMPPNTPRVAVAIVGAGACGLTAALALADAGVEASCSSATRSRRGQPRCRRASSRRPAR